MAIRAAGHLHLEQTEVDAELQLLAPSSPRILRTLMLPDSCGHSCSSVFRSRLIVCLRVGYSLSFCQSRLPGRSDVCKSFRGTGRGRCVALGETFNCPLLFNLRLRPAEALALGEHDGSILVVEAEIDSFIRYLAVERGLSDNYQLSTRRSLAEFATWCAKSRQLSAPGDVTLPLITDYLAHLKHSGLAASSIKLVVVALKIFFRFLTARGRVERDPTETLTLPRIERYLPETLNELQVQQLIESIDTTKPRGLRDRAIVELLYASGLRISSWQTPASRT
jgi:hypothetical protein